MQHSISDIIGYEIRATDGDLGKVDEFYFDDETWMVRFLVVDTRNWLPGKKILLSPHWINRVDWADSSVHFNLTRESIKNSTEFDPLKTGYRDYEAYLCDHYGRPENHH